MNSYNEPIEVETPEQITVYDRARMLLRVADGQYTVHLGPSQAKAIDKRLDWLETQDERDAAVIVDQAKQLAKLEQTVVKLVEIGKPKSFRMWVE